MKTLLIKFGFVVSCATLASCTNLNYPLSTEDGKYAATNFDAQVVDPTPAEGAPEMDAGKADAAYDRYKKDEVKEPFDEEAGQSVSLSFSPE